MGNEFLVLSRRKPGHFLEPFREVGLVGEREHFRSLREGQVFFSEHADDIVEPVFLPELLW